MKGIVDVGHLIVEIWIVKRCFLPSMSPDLRTLDRYSNLNSTCIFPQVVQALQLLARDSVVHFDLKCGNVLIDPRPGVKDSELWNPLAAQTAGAVRQSPRAAAAMAVMVPFEAVLADFGEARSYRSAEEAYTVRNRGTEVYKSPEMLMLNTQQGAAAVAADALPQSARGSGGGGRHPAAEVGSFFGGSLGSPSQTALPLPPGASARASLSGAGLASDVWSLGCLAYELFSGSVLFGGDYASVTHRVAFGGRGNLRLTEAEREALGGRQEVVDLVEWVLARDPTRRPSLGEIERRLVKMQRDLATLAEEELK